MCQEEGAENAEPTCGIGIAYLMVRHLSLGGFQTNARKTGMMNKGRRRGCF